jgi:hypothetical protein
MANRKLEKQDKDKIVVGDIQVKDLTRVINASNEFLKLHRGVMADPQKMAIRDKLYKAQDLAASMLIVFLSQNYCYYAHTLNDVPQEAVKQKLKLDFQIANK